jgi:Rps23 Pro-64 3,4-dihydroxylase Tpa1-like proline 4-hydroxylase
MEAAARPLFFLDSDPLLERARAHADEYRHATPFPHGVFDDFLPTSVIDGCIEEFPEPDDEWRFHTDWGNSKKFTTTDESLMGPTIRQVINELNGRAMITFLEELTGISGLVPDPHLVGGGIHLLGEGGFLEVHADFNMHEHLRLDRRINLLLYLNPEWQEEWGGNLELWNRDKTECVRRIVPIANRCVVFNTTDIALHGNPEPVRCPSGMARRSLAFYYYTAGRPKEERSAPHTTLYPRSGKRAKPPLNARARQVALRVLPPLVVDAVRRVRRRGDLRTH